MFLNISNETDAANYGEGDSGNSSTGTEDENHRKHYPAGMSYDVLKS